MQQFNGFQHHQGITGGDAVARRDAQLGNGARHRGRQQVGAACNDAGAGKVPIFQSAQLCHGHSRRGLQMHPPMMTGAFDVGDG